MATTSTIPHFDLPLADIRAGPQLVCQLPAHHQPIVASTNPFFHTMHNTPPRIFALDPTTKGFGYAVFELPFRLVEWGLARASGDKYAGAIVRFKELLDRFRPDTVVLEDTEAPGSRRYPRVRLLIEALGKLARERGIEVRTLARSAVLKCFSSADRLATKYSIAERLTKDFPELAAKLPPPRKPYESENERMSIFDAVALAVTYANA